MKIVQQGETVNVSDLQELAAANATHFRSAIRAAMPSRPNRIDIDLSQTEFLDCNGVGALIALRKCARQRNAEVIVRLLSPKVATRRLLRLTGLDSLFPIEAL